MTFAFADSLDVFQIVTAIEDEIELEISDEDVIQICEPGGRILDPFAGAGTTILVSVEEVEALAGGDASGRVQR